MKLSWTRSNADQRVFLEANGSEGHQLKVCALVPNRGHTHYLMPVRVFESCASTDSARDSLFARGIEAQTDGLQEKIRAIDRLSLSDVEFGNRIVAARMVISSPSRDAEDTVWDFARQAMRELTEQLELPVASQIDYDQKRLHASLGSILESIDFAVRHDPSAIATTSAFHKMLERAGIPTESLRVSVTGVGDLGSRLVKRFLELGASTVFVSDQDADRLSKIAELPNVEVVASQELGNIECHAYVLSADKSYGDDVAAMWAASRYAVVVGGPEAGMDRFVAAREMLESAGKNYVPSVLCGSMGLVSNLEESLGMIPDLARMTLRYEEMLNRLVSLMSSTGQSLSRTCEALLSGSAQSRTA